MEGIKSKYILEKIFDYIQTGKTLNIIKYNKNIQRNLNITQNDYNEFSKIEIEIIPFKNCDPSYKFIFDEPKFYHVYFNDNKEEVFPHFDVYYDFENATKIKLVIDYEIKSYKKINKKQ